MKRPERHVDKLGTDSGGPCDEKDFSCFFNLLEKVATPEIPVLQTVSVGDKKESLGLKKSGIQI